MRELWGNVDEYVGKIIESLDLSQDNIFLVSDHGFTRIEKTFYLNSWLQDNGWLAARDEGGTRGEDVRFRVKRLAKKMLERLGLLEAAINWIPARLRWTVERPDGIWEQVDWSGTKAFASGQYVGQIYLHTEDEYPQGTVSESEYEEVQQRLIDELREVEDPVTGEQVVEQIWTREELYRDVADFAPDITFYTTDMKYKVKEELHGSVFDESIPRGAHRKTGIFIAAGPDIQEGEADLELIDLAPTLLHLEGSPVPDDMDGDVADIFATGSKPERREILHASDTTAGLDI